MKKSISFLLLLGLYQQAQSKDDLKVEIQVELTGECKGDSMRLYAWDKTQIQPIDAVAGKTNGNKISYTFKGKKLEEGIYYLGHSPQDLRMCFLGTEKKVQLQGKCSDPINLAFFPNSPVNATLDMQLAIYQARNAAFLEVLQKYQQAQGANNPTEMQAMRKEMKNIDQAKRKTLDSLKQINSPLVNLAALNSYQSWHNYGKPNELEQDYIARALFEFVDFKDVRLAGLPFYPETARNFAATLARMQMPMEKQRRYYDSLLALIPNAKHPNHAPFQLGIALGLMTTAPDLFLVYAKGYLQDHKGENAMLDAFLNEQIQKLRGPLPIGEPAPEITAKNVQDQELSLSSLRGKVVLIDFWASWCGPCRRENPFVVQLYEKYKDKGFEIFGVSLDTDKARWANAILQDGLVWPQVSDLGGWRSEPAQRYGVSSIPFTVLLDKDGNVIAKQLRGHNLEAKLKEIFGF